MRHQRSFSLCDASVTITVMTSKFGTVSIDGITVTQSFDVVAVAVVAALLRRLTLNPV